MIKHFRWLAIPLLIGALTGVVPAAAQTMSFADAAEVLVAACGRDIETYCKNVNLGGGKMKACLNNPKVQAGCKTTAAQVFASLEQRAQARINVLKTLRKGCEPPVPGRAARRRPDSRMHDPRPPCSLGELQSGHHRCRLPVRGERP